ncbi:MAG: hypothetical protein JSR85_05815 [Proteobacteria bacterium]|nr:hypothetical protein [Pseudomonadota bacterium]
MCSLALKVNVSKRDQEFINDLMEKAGYERQRRKYHCTFGFIEKMIPDQEVVSFGQKMTQELQELIKRQPPIYEVEMTAHLFGHVIVFSPTSKSLIQLKEINGWLFNKIAELSEGRFRLNKESEPQNYIPHMTLWRTRHLDVRFKKLEELSQTHPSYVLSEAAYVVF